MDLPPEVLQELMAKSTEEVCARLLRGSSPERQAVVRQAIDAVSAQVSRDAAVSCGFRRVEGLLAEMKEIRQRDESAIVKFADAGQHEEMVVGLAKLCGSQVDLIEPLVRNPA